MAEDSAITAEDIGRALACGLPGLWYAVAPSTWIAEKPLGLTRRSEHIVVWRDAAGMVHIFEDRCPHRGAKLSLGSTRDCNIVCGYHGVEVDRDGVIAKVPAFPGSSLVGKKAVKSYPAIEHSGCIWAYFGDGEPANFDLPEDLVEGEWNGFLTTAEWQCNYQYVYDNLIDPMHGAYLHAESYTLAWGSKQDKMVIEDTSRGFLIARAGQRGVNFDWTEFVDSGAHWFRLDIPYPRKAGPGGEFRIVGFVTPIDADRTQVFFWRLRKVDDWQRDMWRFLYKARWEERHWIPLEQDRRMLEGLPKGGRPKEMLYQHDIGVTRLRKMLTKAARQLLIAAHTSPTKHAAE